MKYDRIVNLSKEDFIAELTREGSRVNHAPLMWTINWLRNNDKPYHKLESAQNWVNAVDGERVEQAHRNDVKACLIFLEKIK